MLYVCVHSVVQLMLEKPWKESRSSITNTSKNWDRQKSALHTFKFRNETPIATSSNCFVLSHKQSKPQRYSIYYHSQQILTYFMKNWTQRMFSWNENTSVMKPNPTQTCFLRTLQNPRCIFSQDSHKKKNASLYCRKSTLCLIPACTTSFWN